MTLTKQQLTKKTFVEELKSMQSEKSDKSNKRYYKLDFVCERVNIEFDGDYWHKDTQDYEVEREKILKNRGFVVHRVKESSFKENPQKVVEECTSIIQKNL